MNVYCYTQLIVIHGHEFARTTPWETRPSYSFKTIIMGNYLLSLFVALLAIMGSLPVAAQEAYAVLTSDETLTFYYDNQRATRQNYELIYDMPEHGNYPAWAGFSTYPQKNLKHVVFDVSFSKYRPTSTLSWFECCINLQHIEGIRNLNTEKVTDMRSMFSDCEALTSLDVSNFNTQNVADMSYMFYRCSALTSLDLSNFNTQHITDMSYMFADCKALTSLDVSNFNTQNVASMRNMFEGCKALRSLDVSKFNTQNVVSMSSMFYRCSALTSLDLSNFNTENVTSMSYMFFGCKVLTSLDLSKFNAQNVTNMYCMFSGCESLTTIYCNRNWNVGRLVDDKFMFENCTKLKGTNTAYNLYKTGIEMANPATGYFTSPPGPAKAYAVLTPDQTLTFYYDNLRTTHQNYERIYDMPKPGVPPAWAGDDDNPQKNIKHVVLDASFAKYRPTSTHSWFAHCINLQDIIGIQNLNTEKVTNMWGMFNRCKALTSLDVSKFNTQNVTSMRRMFDGCYALTSLDVSSFNTQKVTDMSYMFEDCEALTSLDVSKFNTQNVTSMSCMFSGCSALTSLDVSKFNTQDVTDMSGMFYGCQALTSLDVSKFNTQKVTDMRYMFDGCTSLTTIFCNNNWKVRYKIYDSFMFNNCTKLKGTNTSYNENKTGIEMANPNTGYFTSKTTGIDNVKTADRAGDGKAYDLSGRRVNESYKGIVIKNGKKYIQK